MATEIELATLAYMSYQPSDENDIDLTSWIENPSLSRTTPSGCAASVSTKGSEVVIAFRGTDFDELADGIADFWNGKIPAARGSYSDQVMDAIKLVADAIALYGKDNITFTGHSLGGGLASLMAAFFDLPAVVFDPAPFALTARSEIIPIIPGAVPVPIPAKRSRVSVFRFLEGEVLDYLRNESYVFPIAASSLQEVPNGDSGLGMIDLHRMDLLLAMMVSPKLQEASEAISDLQERLLDLELYAEEKESDSEENFLNRLLKDQLQGAEINIGGALDRFAEDLLRLGDTGSTHLKRSFPNPDVDMEKSLITTIMEYYNFGDLSDIDPFVESVSNGIRFDVGRIPSDSETNPQKLGQTLLLDSVKNLVTTGSGDLARTWADAADVWTIQSGSNGLTTIGLGDGEVQIGSASQANYLYGAGGNDLLISGSGADGLYGGTGDDVLLSGSGTDLLEGGDGVDYLNGAAGNDTLKGGAGFDTYLFNADDGAGINRIVGDDNDGKIVVDGVTLSGAGAKELGSELAPVWQWSSGGKTFIYTLLDATSTTSGNQVNYSGGTLWAQENGSADRIVVEQYSTGDLSLDLHRTQKNDDAPGAPSDEGGRSGTTDRWPGTVFGCGGLISVI